MATAQAILTAMDDGQPVRPLALLTEVDHGPDEGKTEEAVVARLGAAAIAAWDREGIVPPGWTVDPEARLARMDGAIRGRTPQRPRHPDGDEQRRGAVRAPGARGARRLRRRTGNRSSSPPAPMA